jgi:hypothetical protein
VTEFRLKTMLMPFVIHDLHTQQTS